MKYVCPDCVMPEYRTGGDCPVCYMKLMPVVEAGDCCKGP